ncbi:MAG: DUF2460 domain-containing protein [Rickettsiales bacterium]|jgi:uncharacterized protein (TIGR02217 family)|nr:DUF2460 domain-containing protein [Rickettsiales bacterium]
MFYEINFPDSIAFTSINSLYFDTNIVKSRNNTEQRSNNLDTPLLNFKLITPLKNKQEIDEIVTLFRIVGGKLNGFRFRDWLDYKIENQIIGIGDGESCTFQIKKTYQLGNYFIVRNIVKPVFNTISIFLNQIEYSNSQLQSIDYIRGLIHFAAPPTEGTVITLNCEFDIPVRFSGYSLNIVLTGKNLYEINDLELVEIRDYL